MRKTSKRLLVEKDGKVLLEVPEFKVDQVLVFGNVQITTQAMSFLLEHSIPISLLSIYGRLKGKLVPAESKNIYLRLAQFERFKDEGFKLSLAKDIVSGKIRNQRSLLMRYQRNHPEINLSEEISQLEGLLSLLLSKTKVSTVIGIEGRSSAIYFEAFSKMFRRELQFEGRDRRPPRDPINSLLSLGYTMITNEAFSILSAIGLDPYIGYLHSLDYGRPSLALDLTEEFRQAIIDTLTLSLINKGVLKPSDFEEREEGVYLKDSARKTYLLHYERKMQTELQRPDSKDKMTYRRLIYYQAQRLAKSIKEKTQYQPHLLN